MGGGRGASFSRMSCIFLDDSIPVISNRSDVRVVPERLVPHQLFTPLLTGMVATGVFLSIILVVLLYKYMQVRWEINHMSQYHYCYEEVVILGAINLV